MSKGIIDYFLSNGIPAIAIAALVASILLLFTKRDSMTRSQKILLLVLIVICLLFFIALIWISIEFGRSNPIAQPSLP